MKPHQILTTLLVQLSVYSSITVSEHDIFCVVNSNDKNCTSSLKCNQGNIIKWENIDQVGLVSKDVEFYLCSINYDITYKNFTGFDHLNSISIVGDTNGSHLNCHNGHHLLYFNNITIVKIKDMVFNKCGNIAPSMIGTNMSASVYITNSDNIFIHKVTICNSHGIGMVLSNNSGIMNISSSTFDNNIKGGIFIEYSSSDSSYSPGIGGGGYFDYEIWNVSIVIADCEFENNKAKHGGALCLYFDSSIHDVSVIVERSQFRCNRALKRGGAVSAGYTQISEITDSSIKFHSCNFTNNQAHQGGGVDLFAAPNYSKDNSMSRNFFIFEKCTWELNTGVYGSAVYISPYSSIKFIKYGKFPIPVFNSCQFIRNCIRNDIEQSRSNIVRYGRGAFYVNYLNVNFRGQVTFKENSYKSAVYLFTSILEVSSKSLLIFRNNIGHQGGAFHLRGFSSLHVNDNTSISFIDNHATDKGGAIFHGALREPSESTAIHCFIKYVGNKTKDERNANVYLKNNTANFKNTTREQSIFLFSSKPCSMFHHDNEKGLLLIANFTFEGGIQNYTIATFPSNFSIHCEPPKTVVPGKEVELNIYVTDDTNDQVLLPTYKVKIEETDGISVDNSYTITSNNKIMLQGISGRKGEVEISILEHEDMAYTFNVTLEECPPGYIYNHVISKCMCSTNTKKIYWGIKRCNLTKFQAILVPGYWAGYVRNESIGESTFRTSHCPRGFCSDHNESEILLPGKASHDTLNNLICSDNRMGVMCGQCKENTSVYFHTQRTFECRSDESCNLGILWYMLSVILPVTILFLVIILLNIQLTTGALNGFVFYMQIFDILNINANNFIASFPKYDTVLHLITRMFNLDFFAFPELSFCLIKGANPLHLFLIDYATVAYSLLLILFIVGIQYFRCKKFVPSFLRKRVSLSGSIIHGLSGVLVLCYAKSTQSTLSILKSGTLYGYNNSVQEVRVFYFGDWPHLGKDHIKIAIPAVFALIFITCLPPLLLLVYPLCYKILAVLRLEESRVTKLFCMIIPLEKFKPFFDTFQGTFKDNHRYFAGLFFIYRLLILTLSATIHSLTEFYLYLELQLVFMLALHGCVQPYKYKWHNRLDLCIFTLLIIINGITLYSYLLEVDLFDHKKNTDTLKGIQLILAFSPLLFIMIYILYKLKIKVLMMYICRKKENNIHDLTLSMIDRGRKNQDSDIQYNKI